MDSTPGNGARAWQWVAATTLLLMVSAIYVQARHFGFVNFDDGAYVNHNPVVLRGWTLDGIRWAFVGFHASNWHPVTWLSHMLDVELFGANAGPQHVVNVALHAANAVLLFWVLRDATRSTWRSWAVAALFAVHPLHVESVAWISERKDVLSTLFLLLATGSYVRWTRTRKQGSYLSALLLFAFAQLSKPMVVTFPFVLLLIDMWPLGRLPPDRWSAFVAALRRLAYEKVPFFVIAAAGCVVTSLAQLTGHADESALSPIALWPRAANAVVSYAAYLAHAVWPAGLASFYPHPATIQPDVALLPFCAAAVLLVAATVLVLRERVRRPHLAFGWFWYLGTLVPVIGLVQVGGQAMADRYTYVPLVGVFIAVVWTAAEIAGPRRVPRVVLAMSAAIAIAALAFAAWWQARYWRDSVALHERSIAVTERNWKAWQGLCQARIDADDPSQALPACRAAIEILPAYPEAWQTLGMALARIGRPADAIRCFRQALTLRPDYFNALHNMGSTFGNMGNNAEASIYFREALKLRPDDAETWSYLGLALSRIGDHAGAVEACTRVSRLDPARAPHLCARVERELQERSQ